MGCVRSLPFWGVHVVAIAGVAMTGWSWGGLVLAVALYYARMFFLPAGFHRYFSHRTFKVSRAVQFLLALGGTFCLQKGPLWWAANHRVHHRYADRPGDIHSPRLRGLWWEHAGWVVSQDHTATKWAAIPDLARFPELRYVLTALTWWGVVSELRGVPAVLLAGEARRGSGAGGARPIT